MEKIRELYTAIKEDPQLMADFEKDPIAVLKTLLPEQPVDEALEKLADGVKKLMLKEQMEAMIANAGLFPRA